MMKKPQTDVSGENWYMCPQCNKRKVGREGSLCMYCMTEAKEKPDEKEKED